jgi:hypothetical protein
MCFTLPAHHQIFAAQLLFYQLSSGAYRQPAQHGQMLAFKTGIKRSSNFSRM